MHADAAVNLVVKSDLFIRPVRPARKLHSVHAEIRLRQPRLGDILGVNLRQRDESPCVIGPRNELRQLADPNLLGEHRSSPNALRLHPPGSERRGKIPRRLAK